MPEPSEPDYVPSESAKAMLELADGGDSDDLETALAYLSAIAHSLVEISEQLAKLGWLSHS